MHQKTYAIALSVLAIIIVVTSPTLSAEQDAVYGRWSPPPPDSGTIEIVPCEQGLCAYIRQGEVDEDDNLDGYLLFENFTYLGGFRWAQGTIYNPRNGKSYESKLHLLDSDNLRVKGCWWVFCGSRTWTRIK